MGLTGRERDGSESNEKRRATKGHRPGTKFLANERR
jgi:hypothetical protein